MRRIHSEEPGTGTYVPISIADLGYRHKQVVGGDSREKEIILSCSCPEKVTMGGVLPRIPPGSLQRLRLEGALSRKAPRLGE